MSKQWEWRGFRPGHDSIDLLDLAHRLARCLATGPPVELEEEDDLYLVLPNGHHNVKFRGDQFEVKEHVDDHGEHFSEWFKKRVFDYPIDGEAAELVHRLALERRGDLRGPFTSPDDLLTALQETEPSLATVR